MEGRAGLVATCFAIGLGIGSVVMYLYDPAAGKRRRSHIRHEAKRLKRGVTRSIDKTTHTLSKMARIGLPGLAMGLVPGRARALIGR